MLKTRLVLHFCCAIWIWITFCTTIVSTNQRNIQTRKLGFSKGTILVVSPSLLIPILDPHSGFLSEVGSKLHIELPFTVDLGQFENNYMELLEKEHSLINEMAIVHPWWVKLSQEKKGVKRMPRSVNRNTTSFPFINRQIIFGKLEAVLNSLGLPGRSCLLRTICEVHEFPYWDAYGFVGEMFQTLFRVGKFHEPENNLLGQHLNAQNDGLVGDCYKYTMKCKKSLFTNSM